MCNFMEQLQVEQCEMEWNGKWNGQTKERIRWIGSHRWEVDGVSFLCLSCRTRKVMSLIGNPASHFCIRQTSDLGKSIKNTY
jgi:hypothetical protein